MSLKLPAAIKDLLERKKSDEELDHQPKIPTISDFIQAEITALQNTVPPADPPKAYIEKLNAIFRETLDELCKPPAFCDICPALSLKTLPVLAPVWLHLLVRFV